MTTSPVQKTAFWPSLISCGISSFKETAVAYHEGVLGARDGPKAVDGPMKPLITGRREFRKMAAAVAAASLAHSTAWVRGQQPQGQPLKVCQWGMLGKGLSDVGKIVLAKQSGFQGNEAGGVIADLDHAKELGAMAREAGVPFHSVVFGGWHAPFSDPNPNVIEKGLAGMETAMRSVKALGGGEACLTDLSARIDKVLAMDKA